MPRALWTPLAELELEEILFYIRVEDGRPETARRIGEEYVISSISKPRPLARAQTSGGARRLAVPQVQAMVGLLSITP